MTTCDLICDRSTKQYPLNGKNRLHTLNNREASYYYYYIEEDCTLDRRIKYIEGKLRKSGTTFVTQQQTDIKSLEITDTTPLEKVIFVGNMKGYNHTEGSSPLLDDPQLYSYIGDFGEGPQVEAILDVTYVYIDNTYP